MKGDHVKLKIDNVLFKEAVLIQGAMNTNCKAGYKNSTISYVDGGIMIDIPPYAEYRRFLTFVPYQNIRQIECLEV